MPYINNITTESCAHLFYDIIKAIKKSINVKLILIMTKDTMYLHLNENKNIVFVAGKYG